MSASDAARSRGDVMARLAELTDRVTRLETARRLEAAAVGRGGIRIKGGRLLAEDLENDTVFEVTTQPAGIFMRKELISALALGVFGEAIHVDTVDGSASIGDQDAGNDWIDLPGSPGPTVSDVEISESGRAWVFMTARLSVETHSTDAQIATAAMSYMVSGQTSRQPNLAHALELSNTTQITSGGPVTSVVGATMTRVHTVVGLAPGVHTFTAKYTALVTGSGNRATFSRRELQVIPF